MGSNNAMISHGTGSAAARVVFGAAIALASLTSHAAPAREALVIGNATYAALPPIPACAQSAHTVSAALRGLGFAVVEREDVTSGGADAAIGEFARRLTASPGAAGFVYVCGYATAFNDRAFLLPVSADIARPADVLTQGVLAKSLLDVLTRGGTQAAVLVLDVVPVPGGPTALGLDALAQNSLPDGLGFVAAIQAKPADTPTSLAALLVANLKGPEVQIGPLLAAAGRAATVVAQRPPVAQAYLAGSPAPPAPAAAPVAAASPPPPAPVAKPVVAMPADEQMTEADRRQVQTALARLGYYDGTVDGIFGPDTRAAIRRFQHELGATMTGRLTAAQASKLVGG